jgi:NAD(P)-dependent dehydrogenase (short-subunit alcohol dehydrogenase family)
VERFGRVDILVNNAALFPPSLFLEVTEEVWDRTAEYGSQGRILPRPVRGQGDDRCWQWRPYHQPVVHRCIPAPGTLSAYGAAKLGLWSATQAMAKELAEHRILVNAVTPGATITEERLAKFKNGTFGMLPPAACRSRAQRSCGRPCTIP